MRENEKPMKERDENETSFAYHFHPFPIIYHRMPIIILRICIGAYHKPIINS